MSGIVKYNVVVAPDDGAARNNLGLSLLLSGDYDRAAAELSAVARQPGASPRMRQNLALALGIRGDAAGAAQIASRDLDPAAIAENQRFVGAVRRLAAPGSAVTPTGSDIVAATTPRQ